MAGLRIAAAHRASARVAASAGQHQLAGTVRQVVAATGHACDDVRFTFTPR